MLGQADIMGLYWDIHPHTGFWAKKGFTSSGKNTTLFNFRSSRHVNSIQLAEFQGFKPSSLKIT
jgi:hypothetical protein